MFCYVRCTYVRYAHATDTHTEASHLHTGCALLLMVSAPRCAHMGCTRSSNTAITFHIQLYSRCARQCPPVRALTSASPRLIMLSLTHAACDSDLRVPLHQRSVYILHGHLPAASKSGDDVCLRVSRTHHATRTTYRTPFTHLSARAPASASRSPYSANRLLRAWLGPISIHLAPAASRQNRRAPGTASLHPICISYITWHSHVITHHESIGARHGPACKPIAYSHHIMISTLPRSISICRLQHRPTLSGLLAAHS